MDRTKGFETTSFAVVASDYQIKNFGFEVDDIACPCCGKYKVDVHLLLMAKTVLNLFKKLYPTSFCRCWKHHSELYGGKEPPQLSAHLIDLSNGKPSICRGFDMSGSLEDIREAKTHLTSWYGGFGYYEKPICIHLDLGRKRAW
jgi:hypothetical protein